MKAFECSRCGECCYGEGGIFLEDGEGERIAAFLGMDVEGFLETCTEAGRGRHHLKTGPDGYCLFHEPGGGCRIHAVKPARCALWPFFPALLQDPDTWNLAKGSCPGIRQDCSHEDFVREGKKR